jgi:hypothetical protein
LVWQQHEQRVSAQVREAREQERLHNTFKPTIHTRNTSATRVSRVSSSRAKALADPPGPLTRPTTLLLPTDHAIVPFENT